MFLKQFVRYFSDLKYRFWVNYNLNGQHGLTQVFGPLKNDNIQIKMFVKHFFKLGNLKMNITVVKSA